ncbi:hypothetical protein ISF41_32585 [Burkholderia pseudomallei]|uniref:hypothetical protein n=1 Tax=Burkholderia cenocepacia TaxID=95486 RepID=UPI0019DCB631|nr:hypothetical protein [Burkholderia cenocepacia]MBF3421059.1 hypothetical protein [Burkholderia pseudomallei]MDF0506562.1 hypothetical protein [Burkholderia cenocepacia]
MTPIQSLIATLEQKPQEASRALDVLIHEAVFGERVAPGHTPEYTKSFEAALTLIPPGIAYDLTVYGCGPDGKTYTCAAVQWWIDGRDGPGTWRASNGNKLTPALAMCIAALKFTIEAAEERASRAAAVPA